jgi:hypothetical protein
LKSWEAYKEHRKSFIASFAAIRRALKRYKDRRILLHVCTSKEKLALYNEAFVHYVAKTSFEENTTPSTK